MKIERELTLAPNEFPAVPEITKEVNMYMLEIKPMRRIVTHGSKL